jgi:hypothetical protein
VSRAKNTAAQASATDAKKEFTQRADALAKQNADARDADKSLNGELAQSVLDTALATTSMQERCAELEAANADLHAQLEEALQRLQQEMDDHLASVAAAEKGAAMAKQFEASLQQHADHEVSGMVEMCKHAGVTHMVRIAGRMLHLGEAWAVEGWREQVKASTAMVLDSKAA